MVATYEGSVEFSKVEVADMEIDDAVGFIELLCVIAELTVVIEVLELIDETKIDEIDVFVGITEDNDVDVETDVAIGGIEENIFVAIILFDCEINVVIVGIEEIAVKAIEEETEVVIAEEITMKDVEL